MRLLSWNVARRLQKLDAQAGAVLSAEPDVVALQELTATGIPRWREALAAGGLVHTALSGERLKRHRVLVASRTPLTEVPDAVAAPWPEAVCSVDVDGVRIHAVHVPNAANGWVKVHTLQAVADAVHAETGPRVVCGDLNTPRREIPKFMTFAYDSYGRLRPERGEEWDAGERALFEGPLTDAFRLHHPDGKEPSWEWPRWGGGWRLDHVLVADMEVLDCRYHHEWRRAGLSDHSAIEATLTVRPRPRASAARRSKTS